MTAPAKKIVIVDDEPKNRDVIRLRDGLQRLGYQIEMVLPGHDWTARSTLLEIVSLPQFQGASAILFDGIYIAPNSDVKELQRYQGGTVAHAFFKANHPALLIHIGSQPPLEDFRPFFDLVTSKTDPNVVGILSNLISRQ